jgi:hypothetical protein
MTYAGDEGDGSGGDDGPGRGPGDELLEEGARAGDLDGVLAVVLGEEPFHVLDVWVRRREG